MNRPPADKAVLVLKDNDTGETLKTLVVPRAEVESATAALKEEGKAITAKYPERKDLIVTKLERV